MIIKFSDKIIQQYIGKNVLKILEIFSFEKRIEK